MEHLGISSLWLLAFPVAVIINVAIFGYLFRKENKAKAAARQPRVPVDVQEYASLDA